MKKLLFSSICLMLFNIGSFAQVSGTISGIVTDASNNPVPGVAVFYYGDQDMSTWPAHSFDIRDFKNLTYTNANGSYSLNYTANFTDSLAFGVVDCQDSLQWDMLTTPSGGNSTIDIQLTGCTPVSCNTMLTADTTAGYVTFMAIPLIHKNYAAGNVIHQWTFSDNYTRNTPANPTSNIDTIIRPLSGMPISVEACYIRMASCTSMYQCIGTAGSTPCQAGFYVDTVNSINFQGQVVIWENSTIASGSTNNYHWDFGDGNTSQIQYPSHTYADTGIYQVCLTITSKFNNDSCISTFCDSIGFDSNGNLVYKMHQQGFTINVIDPATVGEQEYNLASEFSLYPNPANDKSVLNWNENIQVKNIDVISINGALIKSFSPKTNSLNITDLSEGVYFVRIQSEQGVATLKMLVH